MIEVENNLINTKKSFQKYIKKILKTKILFSLNIHEQLFWHIKYIIILKGITNIIT
jgi:predicted MarR family transcription regulator